MLDVGHIFNHNKKICIYIVQHIVYLFCSQGLKGDLGSLGPVGPVGPKGNKVSESGLDKIILSFLFLDKNS